MRATVDLYRRHLQALMPRGRAWPTADGATLTRLLGGLAGGLARAHARALELIDEADPRTATELLPDRERLCGLPDCCAPAGGGTLAERRDAVMAKITARGGQSRAFFVDLAARFGYAISIDEFQPFTCESPCEDPIRDAPWRFAWRVNAPETTIRESSCDSPCEEPLRTWGNAVLECEISRRAPAHTHVLFAYRADPLGGLAYTESLSGLLAACTAFVGLVEQDLSRHGW